MRIANGKARYAALIVAAVLMLGLLSGCASLAGKFGIASQAYVDEQLAAARSDLQTEVEQTKQSVAENRSDIDKYAESAAQLEQLIDSVQRTVQTTDELKQLATVLETRLENLPVETIRQLVGILEQYLEGK